MSYLDELALAVKAAVPTDTEVPEDADELFVLYAVLVRALGVRTTARNVHDAWAAWMRGKNPGHESLVPFEDLSPEVQKEDGPFVDAIRAVAARQDQSI